MFGLLFSSNLTLFCSSLSIALYHLCLYSQELFLWPDTFGTSDDDCHLPSLCVRLVWHQWHPSPSPTIIYTVSFFLLASHTVVLLYSTIHLSSTSRHFVSLAHVPLLGHPRKFILLGSEQLLFRESKHPMTPASSELSLVASELCPSCHPT